MREIKYSNEDMLSRLLKYGGVKNYAETAGMLLENFGGRLDSIFDSDSEALGKFKGMTPQAVALIKLIPDCAKIYSTCMWDKNPRLVSTAEKGYYLADRIGSPPVEEFYMMCMNKNGRVTGFKKLSEGGIARTEIDIRKAVEFAVNCNAHEVVVAHNHPSGNMHWSVQDVAVSRQLKEALCLVDIELNDHFIVSNNEYISMNEAGVL